MTKTATFIENKGRTASGATQKLWRLSEPLEGHEFVVTSAVNAMYTGPETYIFPSDSTGKITDYRELGGSYRGALDHERALHGAGYET